MKKLLLSVMAAVLLLMAGCEQQQQAPVQQPPHTHEPHVHNFQKWYMNPEKHWHFCECGARSDEGEHQLQEDGTCDICSGVISKDADGSAVVYLFDQKGKLYCTAWYDADGNMIDEEMK